MLTVYHLMTREPIAAHRSGLDRRIKPIYPALSTISAGASPPTSAANCPIGAGLPSKIALHRVAAFFGEEAELFLGLDAFGDDRHFEAVAEIDHRAHDRRPIAGCGRD